MFSWIGSNTVYIQVGVARTLSLMSKMEEQVKPGSLRCHVKILSRVFRGTGMGVRSRYAIDFCAKFKNDSKRYGN